ncbi:MAG: intradiol ring-cleavage dioxygenase [Anaerolineales bacterium]|uniref:intradiol ring-cleavage dioxygenase n=1 Tax=Candidatus Villigracilis vicinus TaxID=3140679 RepID=UPI003134F1A5|nr:intradiol ring-cleavage dioxygenase [Anaerolineales bacterium]
MDNDDKSIGTILSRRDALRVLGLGSAATLLAACAPEVMETLNPTLMPSTIASPAVTSTLAAVGMPVPACVVRPEMTEGPYFVDEMLNRSDIRNDPSTGALSEGAPLELTFNVSQISVNGCLALEGAQVDIWHCDAFGVYSDVENAVGTKFLRGYQTTDTNGQVKFTTIYPGWYPGRAVHIHFKIRIHGYDFTSQVFFDDAFTDQVYSQEPYASRGERNIRNDRDGIYTHGGEQLLLSATQTEIGYAAVFDIGMQI